MKTFYFTRLKANKKGGFVPISGVYGFTAEQFKTNLHNPTAEKLFQQDLVDGDDRIGVIIFKNGEFEVFCDTNACCLDCFIKDIEYGVYNCLKRENVLFTNNVLTIR